MQEEVLNMSVRKFLKKVGITSQREIEKAIHLAIDDSRINADTVVTAKMTLELDISTEPVEIHGEIHLR